MFLSILNRLKEEQIFVFVADCACERVFTAAGWRTWEHFIINYSARVSHKEGTHLTVQQCDY